MRVEEFGGWFRVRIVRFHDQVFDVAVVLQSDTRLFLFPGHRLSQGRAGSTQEGDRVRPENVLGAMQPTIVGAAQKTLRTTTSLTQVFYPLLIALSAVVGLLAT